MAAPLAVLAPPELERPVQKRGCGAVSKQAETMTSPSMLVTAEQWLPRMLPRLGGALRDTPQLHLEVPALERGAAIQIEREAARHVQRFDQCNRHEIECGQQPIARAVGRVRRTA